MFTSGFVRMTFETFQRPVEVWNWKKRGGVEDPCTIHAVHLLSPREVTSKEGKQILKGKGVALLVTNTKWCSFPLQG